VSIFGFSVAGSGFSVGFSVCFSVGFSVCFSVGFSVSASVGLSVAFVAAGTVFTCVGAGSGGVFGVNIPEKKNITAITIRTISSVAEPATIPMINPTFVFLGCG
jgi:hypothetical protein